MSLKKIKIFLASSSELEADRRELEIAIKRKNDQLIKSNRYIELIVWEDFIDIVSESRLQDEYNNNILQCDLFILLFFTKVGKFTFEEFTTAHDQFLSKGFPKILTYFKNAPVLTGSLNQEDANSLFQFKEKLKKIGHYETEYDTIGELKYHLFEQLSKLDIYDSIATSKEPKNVVQEKPKKKKSNKFLIYGLSLILLGCISYLSYQFIKPLKDAIVQPNNEDVVKKVKKDSVSDAFKIVEVSKYPRYDFFVSKALLKLDLGEYEVAQNLLVEANKEEHEGHKANVILTWIKYIKNFDLLYSELPENIDTTKLYARCIVAETYTVEKDSSGIPREKLLKERSITNWQEVYCDGTHAKKLSKNTIRAIQTSLKERGYYYGPINGEITKFLWASMIFFYEGAACLNVNTPEDCGFYPVEYIATDVMKSLELETS